MHPALRTSLLAWLFSRGAIWLLLPAGPGPILTGAPLPGLTATALETLTNSLSPGPAQALAMLAPWLILEALMLLAGLSVYQFVRKTELPQFAERACWIWFFNPIIAISALNWSAQIAMAAGAIAIAGFTTSHHRRATIAAIIATGCRLEFILLAPAIAIAAKKGFRPKKDHPIIPWLGALIVPISFTFWIGLTWSLAGSANTSLRTLHGTTTWRSLNDWTPTFPLEAICLAALLALLLLTLRYARFFPRWHLLISTPALLLPFLHIPAHLAALSLSWSLPSFAQLGRLTDDRSIERPLLIALTIAYLYLLTT